MQLNYTEIEGRNFTLENAFNVSGRVFRVLWIFAGYGCVGNFVGGATVLRCVLFVVLTDVTAGERRGQRHSKCVLADEKVWTFSGR